MSNKPYQDDLDFGEDNGLNMFDPNNPELNLFDLIDDEMVKLSGSKLHIYLYMRNENFDKVYMEEQNKAVSPTPITVWGHYEPKIIEQQLSNFGIEMSNDQIFTFNKTYITRKLGRPIQAGDIIKPEFEKNKYEVIQVQEESFQIYGTFHLICSTKLLRDSKDVQDRVEPVKDFTQDPFVEFDE